MTDKFSSIVMVQQEDDDSVVVVVVMMMMSRRFGIGHGLPFTNVHSGILYIIHH